MNMKEFKTRRVLSLLLSIALLFSQTGLTALAAEGNYTGGLCSHHTRHTPECGYLAGADCTHEHTTECYATESSCGFTEDEGGAPPHHTQECYALNCLHENGEHDEACDYAPAKPCAYVCETCTGKDSGNVSLGMSSFTVTGFDPLAKDVQQQTVPVGTPPESLNLPNKLAAMGYEMAKDTEIVDSGTPSDAMPEPAPLTIEGVTWELDPANEINADIATYSAEGGSYVFTPVLPQGYTLAENVALPEIWVMVGGVAQTLESDPTNHTFDIGEGDITISQGNDPAMLTVTYGVGQSTGEFAATQEITLTGTSNGGKVVVSTGATANITLNGVDIQFNDGDYDNYGTCAFELQGTATVNLTLAEGTTNTLKSGNKRAGLHVRNRDGIATLTIDGAGSLTATGGWGGAGIGGQYHDDGGIITINGGMVTATGGSYGTGIGGGYGCGGGKITINGGMVTATVPTGAGIGGGYDGTGTTTVTISGGTVTASSLYGAGIGNSGGMGANTTFSTGDNGTAYIVASSISDKNTQTSWSGVIFDGANGKVYKNQTISGEVEIPEDYVLIVPAEIGVTFNGAVVNKGCVTVAGTLTASDWTNEGNGRVFKAKEATINGLAEGQYTAMEDYTPCGSLFVKGGTLNDDYSYEPSTGAIKILKSTTLTITGASANDHIIVSPGLTANITLDGVDIQFNDGDSRINGTCAFEVQGNSTANLTLAVGSVNMKSGYLKAGLQVKAGATLTIGGAGSLNATGGIGGAGIGGDYQGSGGNITINGGTITATGGPYGAGIGGGGSGSGGTIKITGGTVTANGGQDGGSASGGGAGIGGGTRGAGGSIEISGGTVTATGGIYKNSYGLNIDGAGIGGGATGANGSFSTGANGTAYIAASSIPDKSRHNDWSGVIFDGGKGKAYKEQTVSKAIEIPAGYTLTVPAGAKVTFSGKVVNKGSVTVAGTLTANSGWTNEGDGKVFKGSDATIKNLIPEQYTAMDGYTLCDDLFVKGGMLNTDYSYDATTGSITILSGTALTFAGASTRGFVVSNGVTANITLGGVSIWTSNNTSPLDMQNAGASTLTLQQGTINILDGSATSDNGPGIWVPTNLLTLKGTGKLITKGGKSWPGIGRNGGGNILIESGSVEAIGGSYAAGIGGSWGQSGGTITISGGTVKATGGENGAGIGGGYGGSGGTVEISGGTVTATGSSNSAGIGGGYGGSGGAVGISGGTVTATGGENGAGIGGGNGGSGGTIKISGGTVTATGGIGDWYGTPSRGAGIGGGVYGSGGSIEIIGGTVTATGGNNSAGIGGGTYGASGSFSNNSGNPFILASSISNQTGKENSSWGGVIFEGDSGSVYGNPTLATDATIPEGKTLAVPEGTTLTIGSGVTLTNNGTINNYGVLVKTGNLAGSGTLNNPSKVEVSVATNSVGGNVDTATYGDTVTITATTCPKTTINALRSTAVNTVDFYLGSVADENKLGTAEVSNNTATLEVKLNTPIWKAATYTIFAVYGGSDTDNLVDSTGSAPLTVNKAAQTPPVAPTKSSATATIVRLNSIVGSGKGELQFGYQAAGESAPGHWQAYTGFFNLAAATAYTFYTRFAGNDCYQEAVSANGTQIYTLPTTPTGNTGYTIQYADETATAASGYEISTDNGGSWHTAAISVAPGASLYVRVKAIEDGAPESEAQTVTLLARPAAPTVSRENESFAGNSDGKITGTSDLMEYQSSTGSWTNCTGNTVASLAPGTYQVRMKATDLAFVGEAATVTITAGPAKSYMLTATVPAFTAQTYGYSQPSPQAIIITSSGNSVATISSVTVSGDKFTIGGRGDTVSAGGSITSWTVQPKANLDVGLHTATITVSYDNNTTATATVSFTVNQKPITLTIEAISDYTYIGSQIRPEVVVKDGNTALTYNKDYTVNYGDNINAGTNAGSVTVTPRGNYTGNSQTANFTIDKAEERGGTATYSVTKNNAQSYSYNLTALLPSGVAPEHVSGYAYVSHTNKSHLFSDAPSVSGTTLTLPIAIVAESGKSDTVTISFTSQNYEITNAVLTVVTTDKQTQAAPPINVTYTANGETDYTVTISLTEGAQYSFGNDTWGGTNTKTGCMPGETVTGYKRMPETDTYAASTSASQTVTLPLFTVKTPTATPNGGSFSGSVSVSLTSATEDAAIYYTLNGTEPTSGSTPYTGAFTLTESKIVKAVAVKNSMNDSAVLTVSFTKNSGGGSGSGNTPTYTQPTVITPPATPEQPNPPTNGSTTLPGKPDGNGNVNVNVPNQNITDAISAAKKQAGQNGISVTVKIDITQTANSLTATLSRAALDKLIAEGVKELKIESSLISFSFNLDALKEIQKSVTDDLTITAKKLDQTTLSKAAQSAIGSRPAFDFSMQSGGKTITSFGTGSASVWMPYTPAQKETEGGLQAVYVDGSGNVQWITGSSYNKDAKALLFTIGHFSVYGVGYQASVPVFTDITDHWAKDDIVFMAARGLLNGTGATTFSPNAGMTRAMFVTALWRLAGTPQAGEGSAFTDIPAGAYYAQAAKWAAEKGITTGTTTTTFSPDKPVTRQETAVFMQNYAKAMGVQLPKTREAVTFADNASIASWAAEAVRAMQMAGIINGKDGNRFDPTGTATRAEVSAVLRRYVELVVDPATAQGLTVNDSGSAMLYENGKAVKFASRTVDGSTYLFNRSGEAALPEKKYGFYAVQKGDSFWRIAHKLSCTMAELEQLNGKSRYDIIYVGQTLRVPRI